MEKFFNNISGYPKVTFDCTFLKSDDYFYDTLEISSIKSDMQLYVKVDISEFRKYDTIKKANFILPIKSPNRKIILKLFETQEYSISSSIRYVDIADRDKVELDVADECIIYETSREDKNAIFDITKLIRKRIHQGCTTVNFRIWNNSSSTFTVYNPRKVTGELISGSFYNIKETMGFKEYDTQNIGDAGDGKIDLNTSFLTFNLPTFKTSSEIMPITFSGCYSFGTSGLLGKDFRTNYEFIIHNDGRRIIITDYTGANTYFFYMDRNEAKEILKFDTTSIIGTIFVNLNDLSYIVFNGNILMLYLKNGTSIQFITSGTSPSKGKINYINKRLTNQITFTWDGDIVKKINNDEGEELIFSYFGGRISEIQFTKEKKIVSFIYKYIDSNYYLNSLKVKNFEIINNVKKEYLISECDYNYTPVGLIRLFDIKDITNNVQYSYEYSDKWSPNIIRSSFITGLKGYKNYTFVSNEGKMTITNQYGEISNIYFDDIGKVKTITNSEDKYIVYQYQRSYKGEITQLRKAVISTPYNSLTNGNLENVTGNKPSNWNFSNCDENDIIVENTHLPNILGSKAMKISGTPETDKKMSQTLNISGGEGEEWNFSVWGKASFTKNSKFQVIVSFYYPSISLEKEYSFSFNNLDSDYQILSGSAVAEHNYSRIKLSILYNGSNPAYVDNATLYRGSSDVHYNYNEGGQVDGITFSGEEINYGYDEYNNVKDIKTLGSNVSITYNSNNQPLSIIDLSNRKIEYTYNNKGSITSKKNINQKGKVLEVTSIYDSSNNLTETIDSCGYKTFYNYDKRNRLVESLYPGGITKTYKYNMLDYLEEELSHLNTQEDGCTYEYNNINNNLITKITTKNNMIYEFLYDDYERLTDVKLNGMILQSNKFEHDINNNKTDLITKKTYGAASDYSFAYDAKKRLEYIKYNSINLYKFSYTEPNLITIEDFKNNISKNYQYNTNGQLEQVSDNKSNSIKYVYDNINNLQKKIQNINGIKRTYDYNYPYECQEYNLIGHLSRISSSCLNDYLVANINGVTGYGNEPILKLYENVYDEKLGNNIIRLTKERSTIIYNNKDINSNRIDKKVYNGKKFDKYGWDDLFISQKTMYSWIRANGFSYKNQTLFSFGNETTVLYQLKINEYGDLTYYKGSEGFVTPFKVSLNKWNFIGVVMVTNGIDIYLNGAKHTFLFNTNEIKVHDITRIAIGSYMSDSTTQSWLENNQGTNLTMSLDFIYASIGVDGFLTEKTQRIYTDGTKYFNGYKVEQSSSVMYYNQNVYQGMDVISLNGSFVSSSGLKPKEYCYTDNNFKIEKTRMFEYDETLKRHVYGCYEDYINFKDKGKSLLSYNLSLTTTGTISTWVKPSSIYSGDKRYIFVIKASKDIGVYIDSNYIIHAYVGSDSYYTSESVIPNEWNMVTIKWQQNNFFISLQNVNSSESIRISSGDIDMFNCTVNLGCVVGNHNIPTNHLNGNLEMFSYTNSFLNDETINNIYNNGRVTDIRTIYDDDGRIKEKEIKTSDKSLSTSYRYYEENNKQNPIPSSEVSYDGDETIYSYDELGNITHKVIIDIDNNLKEGYNYEYDELKRLKKETRYKENNIFDYSYSYTYDNNGNILTKTIVNKDGAVLNKDIYTYSTDIKDRLLSVTRNQTPDVRVISYNGDNKFFPSSYTTYYQPNDLVWEGKRLKQFGSALYNYDENGIRTSYKLGVYGFDYIIEDSKVIRSINKTQSGTIIVDYHYDEKGQVCGLNYNGQEYFYIRDITGNINKIVDKNGTVIVEYRYTAFGIPTRIVGSNLSIDEYSVACKLIDNNIYIYKGYCYDSYTGLYYLNSRYYDPVIGRFISPDDISYLDSESINGLNLYAYCGNNPVMYVDPNGNFLTWALIFFVAMVAGGGIAGGVSAYQNGTDVGEGIREGMFVGALLSTSIILTVGSFYVAGSYVLGSGFLQTNLALMMFTYGFSTSAGMLEVGVTQYRLSRSKGEAGMSHVIDAMLDNSLKIYGINALGKMLPFAQNFTWHWGAIKPGSTGPIHDFYSVKEAWGLFKGFLGKKPTKISYTVAAVSFVTSAYKLFNAAFGEPDYNAWKLY